ncbi:Cytochrome bd ubiquinol oxidase subunit 1 [Paraburkholderia ultramafica]|uniref:Cytochrome bd ubiquinol oxidase subunit 1 n=1 Tax=Paraburkholderia ultramafica TaxID=1544867 RepID=A0A6S7D7Q6_9BURK|nr:cytochrome ubiquinol oxidase subunit I [Paraburkholderia ultramafica]CAB3809759.1 Cytochrome bd ubiquinol oxidase subunit 1 [Paraburkholderia ultramafica]
MDTDVEALDLAREQFSVTILFQILWPSLTISLSAFLLLVETQWAKTCEVVCYRHARCRSRLVLLNVVICVVSGIPMAVQFGTNWGASLHYQDPVAGSILGFEGASVFMLEACFVGIMMLGWNRVPKDVHLLAAVVVAVGVSLAAFWITVGNSRRQTTAGAAAFDGEFGFRHRVRDHGWLPPIPTPPVPRQHRLSEARTTSLTGILYKHVPIDAVHSLVGRS